MPMNKKEYKLIYDEENKPIRIQYGRFTKLNSLEDIVNELNNLKSTVYYHIRTINRLESLLNEKVKPTYDDLYLDIDPETNRCKYERTFVCDKCGAFSNYFLDCRLMFGDSQYQKALELGLVEKNEK